MQDLIKNIVLNVDLYLLNDLCIEELRNMVNEDCDESSSKKNGNI